MNWFCLPSSERDLPLRNIIFFELVSKLHFTRKMFNEFQPKTGLKLVLGATEILGSIELSVPRHGYQLQKHQSKRLCRRCLACQALIFLLKSNKIHSVFHRIAHKTNNRPLQIIARRSISKVSDAGATWIHPTKFSERVKNVVHLFRLQLNVCACIECEDQQQISSSASISISMKLA